MAATKQRYFFGMHGMSKRGWKKEKGEILYISGRDDQITISTKLLYITHESYGFSAHLTETIN